MKSTVKVCIHKRSKRPKKRRNVVLIEVMVAIFVLALVAVPLLEPSIAMVLQERRAVQQLLLDTKIRRAHVAIVEQLYENTITWEMIKDGEWNEFSDRSNHKKEIEYRISGAERKKRKNKKEGDPGQYLVDLEIKGKLQKETMTRTFRHYLLIGNRPV